MQFEFNKRDYEPELDCSQLEACFENLKMGDTIKHKGEKYIVLEDIGEHYSELICRVETGEVFHWTRLFESKKQSKGFQL